MNQRPRRVSDAGLSLIEVLVSLAIFAIIGVAGLAVLNTVSRTGERTDGRLDRLADIDRTFLILRRDLMQMDAASATLDAGVLRFLRPLKDGSVAVTYLSADGVLVRRIEGASSGDVDQRLLDDVSTALWQLMDGTGRWHAVWPPVAGDDPQRPHAAELSLDLSLEGGQVGSIVRLFPLAAGQGG